MSKILRITPTTGDISGEERLFGQLKPSAATPTSIYSPNPNLSGIISTISICNTGTGAAKIEIYVHDTGTTYDNTTMVYNDPALAAGSSTILTVYMPINNVLGNMAVESDTGDVNFTVWGVEVSG